MRSCRKIGRVVALQAPKLQDRQCLLCTKLCSVTYSVAVALLAILASWIVTQKAHAFVGTRAEDRGWPRDDVRQISRAAPEVLRSRGLVDDSG